MAIALLLAVVLLLLGIGSALRQRSALRTLAQRTMVPSDEYSYLRGQARRRMMIAVMLMLTGLLIGGSFLSGIEAEATAIGERGQPGQPATPEEDRFFKFYTALWSVILLLIAGVVGCSLHDAWAARRYWHRVYREIRENHNALMHRDLALYRQQKMEEREARIRRGLDGDS